MSDSTKLLQRKLRKLFRDPGLFLSDAVRNRMPRGGGIHRPYAVFEGGQDSVAFSAELLVEEIARRYPVLHTVHDREFGFGVLEKHVIGVIQLVARFSETHGHQLTVRASTTTESALRGVSEELLEALRHASHFTVRVSTLRHTLLSFPVHIYRKREDVLRCDGPLVMSHIPKAATRRLWDGGKGQHWPCELLDPNVAPREPREDVDIVYTWVDSSDATWRELYETFHGTEIDEDRFSSRDELKHSLRSVHYYCGWVRKIHIVTNCEPPTWLDTSHEKIVWIDHKDVLRAENLPSFNCHAIETGFLEIEGLSSRFIYFNDDFFVTRPLRRRTFFDRSGRGQVYLEGVGNLARDRRPREESWYEARLTAQRRLLEKRGYAATRIARHAPYVVLRERAVEMFDEFRQDVERIAAQRLRSDDDIPLLSFLYGHYAIAGGFGVSQDVRAEILDIGNAVGFELEEGTHFLCINDGQGSASDRSFVRTTAEFMEQRFPHAAPWER